jgi:tetratricopeptide (TPR) repeat protein
VKRLLQLPLGLFVILEIPVSVPTTAQQPSVIIEILNRYERGDLFVALETSDLDMLADELVAHGEKWANAAGRDAAPRRRLIAATFGLEVASARFREEWGNVRHVIEWGCRLVRRGPPSEGERLWHLASVSLIEGAGDTGLLMAPGRRPGLTNHLSHAHSRFPADIRFPFSDAVAHERGVDERGRDEPWEPDAALKRRAPFESRAELELLRRENTRRYLERLRQVQADPTVGVEAQLRAGRLLHILHESAQAITAFNEVLKRSDDPFFVHLAHLFSGRSYEQLEERDRASTAYRQALEAVPGAQAASMHLAALLAADGRPTEAYAVMKSSFALQPRDPWRVYGYGSFRFWPQYMAALRREIWP